MQLSPAVIPAYFGFISIMFYQFEVQGLDQMYDPEKN